MADVKITDLAAYTNTDATNSTDTLDPSFDAWHVNAKFTTGIPSGWDAYLVTPSSPVRVFAGD